MPTPGWELWFHDLMLSQQLIDGSYPIEYRHQAASGAPESKVAGLGAMNVSLERLGIEQAANNQRFVAMILQRLQNFAELQILAALQPHHSL